MNKYTVMLTTILTAAGRTCVTESTKLSELFDDGWKVENWIYATTTFELFVAREIGVTLLHNYEHTIAEFCTEVQNLPEIPEKDYGEFFDLSAQAIQGAYDQVQIDEKKYDEQESIRLREKWEDVIQRFKEYRIRVFGEIG